MNPQFVLKKLKCIVERQIQDECIWHDVQTPLEYYLQKALYHLHAVIEGDEISELYYAKKYGKKDDDKPNKP